MREVINNINKYILDNSVLVVAVSGGPDSMVLLDILLKLREKKNLNIVVAHVNHKLRKESDAEAVMVNDFCKENELICENFTIDGYDKGNIENQAREKRYSFFEKIVNKCKADYLLTAHHGDDLIETMMMRVVRGSSFRGYAGFGIVSDKSNYKIVRPLINSTKEELIYYAKEHNIKFATDKSNFDLSYTRNRFRLNILPYLKDEDKNVHNKFYKFSTLLSEYDNYVEDDVKSIFPKVVCDNKIALEEFRCLKPLIQRRIVQKVLSTLYGNNIYVLNDKHIDMIISLKDKRCQNINLPCGIIAIKNYTSIYFDLNNKKKCEYNMVLEDKNVLPNGHTIVKVNSINDKSNYVCRLDSKEVHMPLYIRTRKNGDKIILKGLNKEKKIKDIFIDDKVDKEIRDTIPIVVDSNGDILWIPGIKKSKFDKQITENYDIILWYS